MVSTDLLLLVSHWKKVSGLSPYRCCCLGRGRPLGGSAKTGGRLSVRDFRCYWGDRAVPQVRFLGTLVGQETFCLPGLRAAFGGRKKRGEGSLDRLVYTFVPAVLKALGLAS